MYSLFIPELGGQSYAMTGMTTQLHIIVTNNGKHRGFSANYTGHGFAETQFYAQVTDQAVCDAWVKVIQNSKNLVLT